MVKKETNTIWIAVKVERGFPAKVQVFHSERTALIQERLWRKKMNLDYDDTGVFEAIVGENDPPLDSL